MRAAAAPSALITERGARGSSLPRMCQFIMMATGTQACPFAALLGRVVVKRFQNFSIDPALMSVAGSALLFGIGTEALP